MAGNYASIVKMNKRLKKTFFGKCPEFQINGINEAVCGVWSVFIGLEPRGPVCKGESTPTSGGVDKLSIYMNLNSSLLSVIKIMNDPTPPYNLAMLIL